MFLFTLAIVSCQQNTSLNVTNSSQATDKHSLSEPQKAVVKHLDLDLKVNFETQILTGKAVWTIENLSKTGEITFDTRDLNIEKITIGADDKSTTFELGEAVKFLGRPLKVKIEPGTTQVSIWYTTSKDAAALQWLNPQQTAGKKQPFLFTQ